MMIGPQHSALPTQGVYFDADLDEVEEFERFCERRERNNGERDYFLWPNGYLATEVAVMVEYKTEEVQRESM